MRKITLLLITLLGTTTVFGQQKSTGNITLASNMTANFTLNNTTSKVTLVLTGPPDRWFALGIGVANGFGMASGDVLVYSTSLSDARFVGTAAPTADTSQDWTTVSNIVASGIRTLTLTRNLTNTDANDFQLPYASTNSIAVAWAKSGSASTALANHGTSNRGFATATLTLANDEFSLNAAQIYPNPASNNFFVTTTAPLNEINVYSHTGNLVKKITVDNFANEVEIDTNNFQTGIYLIELINENEKSWKKIIVQ